MLHLTNSEVLLQRNSIEKILMGIKRKSPRMLLLAEKASRLKESAETEEQEVSRMIEFLAALDGAKRKKGERKNKEAIDQAITVVLDIMKRMGCVEIITEQGSTMDSCNTHEATMFLKSLDRFIKELATLSPDMKPGTFIGDAIHDAYACYKYLLRRKILYAIPYAHKPPKCSAWHGKPLSQDESSKEISVNEDGIPLNLINQAI